MPLLLRTVKGSSQDHVYSWENIWTCGCLLAFILFFVLFQFLFIKNFFFFYIPIAVSPLSSPPTPSSPPMLYPSLHYSCFCSERQATIPAIASTHVRQQLLGTGSLYHVHLPVFLDWPGIRDLPGLGPINTGIIGLRHYMTASN